MGLLTTQGGGLGTTCSALALLGALSAGCGQTGAKPRGGQSVGDAGSGGEGATNGEGGGLSRGGSNGGQAAAPCLGTDVALPKRLVRLSFSQVLHAVGTFTDDAQAQSLASSYEVGDALQRTFPPLASPREGAAFTPTSWAKSDQIAAEVASFALEHLAEFSGCGASPAEACVRAFLPTFAERAYRRPLSGDDEASLLQVVSEVIAAGDTPAEALRTGVHAVFESPQFLYRSEFGVEPKAAGPLTPHEMASQLSFFLTDGPPDQPLLDAAAADALSEPVDISAQVERLLQSRATQQNLEGALFAYFSLPNLETVKLDDAAFTGGVRASMQLESSRFLANTLWSGPFAQLLTSRSASINASLAPFYGLATFPPAGVTPDAEGFALVELPSNRAGLLTQLGFLTARSRPDAASVVGRGLQVNSAILCAQNPSFPENLPTELRNDPSLATATEREKAEFRGRTAPCNACHTQFDPYGLALGNFDLLGRYVTTDASGRVIDATVTLPELAGGKHVSSAAEMAEQLAGSEAFRSCMTKSMLLYALADLSSINADSTSLTSNGCATRATADELDESATFSELLTHIAISSTFRLRAADVGAP